MHTNTPPPSTAGSREALDCRWWRIVRVYRCHKILGTPIKMGTPGPHFPGEMGTPMGKWGTPTVWLPWVSCKATSRPVSSVPVYEVYKMEQSRSCLVSPNPEWKRQSGRTRTVYIHRYTTYIAIRYTLLSSRWPLMITAKYYRPGLTHDVKEYISCLVNKVYIATAVAVLW